MGRSSRTGSVPHTSVRIYLLPILMLICAAPLGVTAQINPTALQSAAQTTAATVPQPYHVVKTIPLSFNPPPGSAIAFDSVNRKLFIPAEKDIYVVDIDSGVLAGQVRKAGHISDIAFAPEINRGFAVDSDGHLLIFDLQTYAVLAKVHAGSESGSVLFDPGTKEVFTVGDSKQCNVFDAITGKIAKTVKLGGYTYRGVGDSMGHIYYELASDVKEGPRSLTAGVTVLGRVPLRKVPGKIVELNARTLEIENVWVEPACINTSGIGIDSEHRRLVVGCENSVDLIDADTGKVVSAIPFPPARLVLRIVFNASLGDAFVTAIGPSQIIVLRENSANNLAFAGIVAQETPWDMAFDPAGGEFFVLKSDEKMVEAPFMIEAHGRVSPREIPKPVPGTFRIVVYGKN